MKTSECVCNEVLENIKLALHKCSDNKSIYKIKEKLDLNKCENLKNFAKTLHVTKTKIKTPTEKLEKKYYIEYIVKDRILIIDKEN
jgi:hypothetical protein